MLAGAGYAVLYTNPRGSQGYGEAFAEPSVGDWGGGDYRDVHGGVDEALAPLGRIDRGAAGRPGRQLRRLHDQLDRRPHRPLQPPAPSAR